MWTYSQQSGMLRHNGLTVGIGYAGFGDGKNNPAMQDQHNVGPLPKGKYTIGAPVDTKTHGPYVLALTPDPANQMFGRAGFLMHSDAVFHPGRASQGCIVISTDIRRQVWTSEDHDLTVV